MRITLQFTKSLIFFIDDQLSSVRISLPDQIYSVEFLVPVRECRAIAAILHSACSCTFH